MKQLTITYAMLDEKQGKLVDKTETFIVASTKSQNNLVEDLAKNNKFKKDLKAVDLFVSREAVTSALHEVIAKEYPALADALTAHAVDALDGACMFKR